MEASDRIKEILRREHISGLKLCKLLGVSDNTFKSLTSGRTQSITNKLANGIVELFPHYNKLWLLTGDGEMLTQKKSDNDINIIATQQDVTTELIRQEIKDVRKQLEESQKQTEIMEQQLELMREEFKTMRDFAAQLLGSITMQPKPSGHTTTRNVSQMASEPDPIQD